MKDVHFPFWAKKVRGEIQVLPLWDVALASSHDLQCLLDEYVNAPVPEADMADEEPEPKGKGKGKGLGKGKKGAGKQDAAGRGGWLPHMAKLVAEVLDDNWGTAKNFCWGYIEDSAALKSLVTKRVFEPSSSSSSGSGSAAWR